MSIDAPGLRRTERTLLRVMFWLPGSPSTYTRPSRFTTMPCSSATRGSGRWISQLALRPTRSHSPSTTLRTGVRPGARVTTRTFKRSPVDEDREHVRHQRRQHHEGERHVQVEPQVKDRLQPQVAARALQQLVLVQQKAKHLLVDARR